MFSDPCHDKDHVLAAVAVLSRRVVYPILGRATRLRHNYGD